MRAALLLALCLTPGCGGPALVPASGRVTFRDGQPVSGGVVEFVPDGGGPEARGSIGPDGRFALATGGEPGAKPGRYRVAVIQVLAPDAPNHAHGPKPPRPHAKHAKSETSGLTATVGPGGGEVMLTVEAG